MFYIGNIQNVNFWQHFYKSTTFILSLYISFNDNIRMWPLTTSTKGITFVLFFYRPKVINPELLPLAIFYKGITFILSLYIFFSDNIQYAVNGRILQEHNFYFITLGTLMDNFWKVANGHLILGAQFLFYPFICLEW